jgi:hypothetical protein
VVECLSRIIHNERLAAKIKGIKISINFSLTHLLFVDDILIFCEGNISYISTLKEILNTFCLATRMKINKDKSSLFSWGLSDFECQHISRALGTPVLKNLEGMKYLGFHSKGKQLQQIGLAMALCKN